MLLWVLLVAFLARCALSTKFQLGQRDNVNTTTDANDSSNSTIVTGAFIVELEDGAVSLCVVYTK
jgi:hypothetical protein